MRSDTLRSIHKAMAISSPNLLVKEERGQFILKGGRFPIQRCHVQNR